MDIKKDFFKIQLLFIILAAIPSYHYIQADHKISDKDLEIEDAINSLSIKYFISTTYQDNQSKNFFSPYAKVIDELNKRGNIFQLHSPILEYIFLEGEKLIYTSCHIFCAVINFLNIFFLIIIISSYSFRFECNRKAITSSF